jgi:NAD(P)-dependent dehydrogenase (short-subunit alcohol dehydrogenase family)
MISMLAETGSAATAPGRGQAADAVPTDPLIATVPGCAWIAGASTGIGRALTLRLARAGWTVVASARRADLLQTLVDEAGAGEAGGGRILPLPLDVTDRAALGAGRDRIEATLGTPALVVAAAGTYDPMGAEQFDAERYRATIELNLMGTVNLLDTVMPGMIRRGGGRIAVLASVAGYRGLPTAASYGASKAALINLCEALKPDLDRHGVRLNLVAPGFVRTPLTDQNSFAMPHLMEVEDAAEALYRGLRGKRFEITFPKRFTWQLKLLRLLPYALFFPIIRWTTGK